MIALKEKNFEWSTWDNQTRLEQLLKVGKEYEQIVARHAWYVQKIYEEYSLHPSCTMCSDGRVNLAKYAKCYEGEMFPYRSIGGVFHYGEPAFKKEINESVIYANQKKRISLILITFHYDDKDPKRCCAGWKNDTKKAMQSAFKLRDQFRRVFVDGSVCPIVVGMETSNEELTFYDEIPEKFIRSTQMNGMEDGEIYENIQITMGKFIPSNVKKYILRLIKGNIEHMSEHEEARHEVSMDHHEFAICFGRGFQWIPPHRGIIINPSFNSLRELLQAVDIQAKNQERGRVKNGCLLVVCTPYREIAKIPAAKEQTRDLTHFALKHIWSHRPDVHSELRVLSVIINVETKELTLVDMYPETLEFKPLEPIEYNEIQSGEKIIYTE